jgi:hypothetical protein
MPASYRNQLARSTATGRLQSFSAFYLMNAIAALQSFAYGSRLKAESGPSCKATTGRSRPISVIFNRERQTLWSLAFRQRICQAKASIIQLLFPVC